MQNKPNKPADKKNLFQNIGSFFNNSTYIFSYMILIGLYSVLSLVRRLGDKVSLFAKLERPLDKFVHLLDRHQANSISRIELIGLALQNMKSKKSRTFITIGGMTIGIAAIVFLVSIGYGLQSLVINRVARLDEMKQTDVTVQPGSKLTINQDVVKVIKTFSNVELALPQIAVVGKVNFNNSSTDMAAYGVTRDYLEQSAISPVIGDIFSSNDIETSIIAAKQDEPTTSKIDTLKEGEVGSKIRSVNFTVNKDKWVEVNQYANTDSSILGYISSEIGKVTADEVWGGTYPDSETNGSAGQTAAGTKLSRWLKIRTPLWQKTAQGYEPILNDQQQQSKVTGYIREVNITATETGDLEIVKETITDDGEWVELEGESDTAKTQVVSKVKLSDEITDLDAVVNRGFIKVLGLDENQSIGQKFSVTFIATGKLLNEDQDRIESIPVEYTIIGVTPDERTPLFYVPLVHLRSLGIYNYSQAKIVVNKEQNLAEVRERIESQGYSTSSVSDTVSQINSLFATLRLLLALVGMVALSVAALGMFNTLTVSLLERTREVGLLKAMGMKSYEVRDLFLAESMIMGSLGGILGITVGLLIGFILQLILSAFSIIKGAGFLSIINIPLPFAFAIILLSFIVGILTGIYPARRAKKITALNALRYE